jgi:hypothetical protein
MLLVAPDLRRAHLARGLGGETPPGQPSRTAAFRLR